MKIFRFGCAWLLSALRVACGSQPVKEGSIPLFEDLGSHHHAVTTSNELAQKYFDQGLRLIFGFNHDEAERAFREAARLDPKSAMAWWGVAYALGPNYNLPMSPEQNTKALEAVHKAQLLQTSASEQERAYVAAVAVRYSANLPPDGGKLDRPNAKAMRALTRDSPELNTPAEPF